MTRVTQEQYPDLVDQDEAEILRFRTFRFMRLRLFLPDSLNRTWRFAGPLNGLSGLRAEGALHELQDDGTDAVVEVNADAQKEGKKVGVFHAKLLPVGSPGIESQNWN